MTRQEWLDYKELTQMLEQVKGNRKKQLFALACCRSIEHLMQDQRSKDCLEKIELFIDGKISKEEFELAKQASWAAANTTAAKANATAAKANAYWVSATAANATAGNTAYWVSATAANAYWAANAANNEGNERLKQIELLRDIYNPNLLNIKFSDQAISLAEQVYNKDDTARGILSDYLEEQGYPAEIVLHLKSGFHPKGCWLIDQILEKT